MYTLIDLNSESQVDYLNSALRRHGVDSYVLETGIDASGGKVFSISCFNAHDIKQARYLIYSSQDFLLDIHPEASLVVREMRHQNTKIIIGLLCSKPMLVIAFIALSAALAGYIFDF